MDMFYNLPSVVANSAKVHYDGGLLMGILNRLDFSFSSSNDDSGLPPTHENIVYLIREHTMRTLQSGGFIVGLISMLLWVISILFTIGIIWKLRYAASSNNYDAEDTVRGEEARQPFVIVDHHHHLNHDSKQRSVMMSKLFFLQIPGLIERSKVELRKRVYFDRVILIAISLSAFFTIISGIFGFITTSEMHVNLSTQMHVMESNFTRENVHNLLGHGNAIIPRIISSSASLIIFMDGFYENTVKRVNPIIDQLVKRTIGLQEESSTKFAEKLEHLLGTDQLSTDATVLIDLNIELRDKLANLNQLNQEYTEQVSLLEKNKRIWAISIGDNRPEECKNECLELFNKVSYDIKVRQPVEVIPNTLEFIYNELISENLEAKHVKNAEVRKRQQDQSIQELNKVINISAEVRRSVVSKFDEIDSKIRENRDSIVEKILGYLNETEGPIQKYPGIILGFNIIFWLLILISGIFIFINIYIFYLGKIKITRSQEKTLRALSCLCYAFICLMLIYSCVLFMAGSFLYCEGCRYMNPGQSLVYRNDEPKAYLDVELNSLLDRLWPQIEKEAAAHSKDPLPRVRDFIYGLSMRCQSNVGILAALDAIDSYDYSSVVDPELTTRILEHGKGILVKTLREFDLANFMDQKEESSLGQIHKTDVEISLENMNQTFFEIVDPPRSLTWDELQQVNYNITSYVINPSVVNGNFTLIRNNVITLRDIMSRITDAIVDFNKRKRASPLANKILDQIKILRANLNNRDDLIESAKELFDKTVGINTGPDSLKLAKEFGPQIMSSVGGCLSLHHAYNDINISVCSSFLGPLNCLWFFAGLAAMFSTIGNVIVNLFLYDDHDDVDDVSGRVDGSATTNNGKDSQEVGRDHI